MEQCHPDQLRRLGRITLGISLNHFLPNSVLRSAVNIVVCMNLTLNACIKDELWLWFDAFELWCWRRHLRVPWTARRSNQVILKEISPEYSLEELMLNLHYFGHLMRRSNSLEKTLMLGRVEGRRRRRWQTMRWLDGITDSTDMKMRKLWEIVEDRRAWLAVVHWVTKS